ncbi:MAG: hypothetical protein WCP63_13475 [Cyanobium sp. ELA712]
MTSFSTSGLLLFSFNRLPHAVLMAGGLALTCVLGSTPAQAADQYCTLSSPGTCKFNSGFNGDTDTYFWSPNSKPRNYVINLAASPFATNKVKKLTLRSSNTVPLDAHGDPNQAEVLIGSLGNNVLQGNGAPAGLADTYVVGNLPVGFSCGPSSGVYCVFTGNQGNEGNESDTVVLTSSGTAVIYIDRCLQMNAPFFNGQPGKGGRMINKAEQTLGSGPYQEITDATGTCPVASLGINDLQATALRGREALLTPWERLWSTTAPWTQGLHWLRQAMVALIQGPHARAAEASITPQRHNSQTPLQIPTYEGVTRVIQKDPRGNFLLAGGESGSTIVVNAGNLRFNQQILQPNRSNGTVYKQIGNEPIPLNQGHVFIYHEPIGILASYSNDRYPYGSERNRGKVIAQLVLGDATALPARSIDYVLLKNLY